MTNDNKSQNSEKVKKLKKSDTLDLLIQLNMSVNKIMSDINEIKNQLSELRFAIEEIYRKEREERKIEKTLDKSFLEQYISQTSIDALERKFAMNKYLQEILIMLTEKFTEYLKDLESEGKVKDWKILITHHVDEVVEPPVDMIIIWLKGKFMFEEKEMEQFKERKIKEIVNTVANYYLTRYPIDARLINDAIEQINVFVAEES